MGGARRWRGSTGAIQFYRRASWSRPHRLTRHCIGRMERRHIGFRKRWITHGWRTVWRESLGRGALNQAFTRLQTGPAFFVGRHEIDVQVEGVDLPDSAVFQVGILVNTVAPLRMFLVLVVLAVFASACCGAAVVVCFV